MPSILVKTEIENQIPAIKEIYSPLPVTSQLDGVRVKLNYGRYKDEIGNVKVDDYFLKDVSEIKKSFMYDYTMVKLLPESSIL